MTTVAMTGHQFEHFVARVLHDNGHHAAVTKGSGDFGVDLVLNGEIAVQVKLYGSAVGPGAVQQVVAGMSMYSCSEAWVITNSTFTVAAVRLASANSVRLIGGDELDWMAANPDRTADHRVRYLNHLAEVRAKEQAAAAEALARNRAAAAEALTRDRAESALREAERIAQRFSDARLQEIAKRSWEEAIRIEQIALWKARLEADIASGARSAATEQSRLASATRILAKARYTLPEAAVAEQASWGVAVAEAAISNELRNPEVSSAEELRNAEPPADSRFRRLLQAAQAKREAEVEQPANAWIAAMKARRDSL